MGKKTGFKEFDRQVEAKRPPAERIEHYNEFTEPMAKEELETQGARCMDCGIPFCHSGCPLGNLIPDFNDLVYTGKERCSASTGKIISLKKRAGRKNDICKPGSRCHKLLLNHDELQGLKSLNCLVDVKHLI